jgi:hypothetical protein
VGVTSCGFGLLDRKIAEGLIKSKRRLTININTPVLHSRVEREMPVLRGSLLLPYAEEYDALELVHDLVVLAGSNPKHLGASLETSSSKNL